MDYRVKITIRNNRILKAIEEQGHLSVASFCRAHGLSYPILVEIISGKRKPLKENGELTSYVSDLLDRLQLTIEDAFTEKQLSGFNKNSFQIEMKESQLTSLMSPVQSTELLAMEQDVTSTLKNLMNKILSPREERLIREYYFEKKPMTEIAKELSVSNTRSQQIINKGLFKLSKHYGALDKCGIKEVFPGVGNESALEIKNDYGSLRRVTKKQKEEHNDHMER
jgi:RNA polymerase sigma factor (sigma-70 family)